jgi:hypothetical protein
MFERNKNVDRHSSKQRNNIRDLIEPLLFSLYITFKNDKFNAFSLGQSFEIEEYPWCNKKYLIIDVEENSLE